MGSTTSSPSSNVNTTQEGTQIGEIKTPQLLVLYQAAPEATVGATAPQSNPCELSDANLTAKDVMAEYPGFQWDPTKPWTP